LAVDLEWNVSPLAPAILLWLDPRLPAMHLVHSANMKSIGYLSEWYAPRPIEKLPNKPLQGKGVPIDTS
jgi:hypothetical protein